MDLESISSISCETRNNYDKKICENLNHDKISNFLSNLSIFDKNKYLLDSKVKTINDYSKEDCAKYNIDNKYKGFTYNGDKNKCLIYGYYNLKETEDNKYNDYKKKTFLKTKDSINIKLEDQLDSTKYFNITNNNKYVYKNNIDEINVNNENHCLDACLNNNKCKSVIYLETPKKCDFYNKIKINHKEIVNNEFDVYTLNKNKMKDQKELINNLLKEKKSTNNKIYNYCTLKDDKCTNYEESNNNNIKYETNDNLPVYDCGGIYSTNPFCTKEYSEIDNKEYLDKKEKDKYSLYTDCINTKNINNIEKENIIYNNECKKKYGNEYIFDNDLFNMESKLECEDGGNKVKCKLDFEDKFILDHKNLSSKSIEHFNNACDGNSSKKYNINNYFFIIIFLIIIIFILFLHKINYI